MRKSPARPPSAQADDGERDPVDQLVVDLRPATRSGRPGAGARRGSPRTARRARCRARARRGDRPRTGPRTRSGRHGAALGSGSAGSRAVLGDQAGGEIVRACSRRPTAPRSSPPAPSSPASRGRCSSRRRARRASRRPPARGHTAARWSSRHASHAPQSVRRALRSSAYRESAARKGRVPNRSPQRIELERFERAAIGSPSQKPST